MSAMTPAERIADLTYALAKAQENLVKARKLNLRAFVSQLRKDVAAYTAELEELKRYAVALG